jgi:hypothetical protein
MPYCIKNNVVVLNSRAASLIVFSNTLFLTDARSDELPRLLYNTIIRSSTLEADKFIASQNGICEIVNADPWLFSYGSDAYLNKPCTRP